MDNFTATLAVAGKSFRWLPLLMILLLASCNDGDSGGQEQERRLSADGYKVSPEPFTVTIRATGDLLSFEEVELRTPVSGNVLSIHFREGQHVSRGTLLAEIDNRTWKAQKRGLEARLQSVQSELERKRGLLEIEGVSLEEVERSEAEASELEARIEELEVMIDLSQVRAPFAGRLGMRDFSPGAFLSQGDVITRLVQTDRIRVHFSIPARYSALAREGQDVQVIASANGDTAVARVYAIDPSINPATRNRQLRAELPNPDGRFVAGDFVQVVFETDRDEDALLVPAESIIAQMGSQVVYKVENGSARRQEVEIGSRTRDRVHVLSGLQAGDTVLVTGLMEVRDGAPVEIRELKQEGSQ
jgi:membrane fusion protein, multidrug efflux system